MNNESDAGGQRKIRLVWLGADVRLKGTEKYSPFASTRYRALQPAAALRAMGVHAEVFDVKALAAREGAAALGAADVVVLQKLVPDAGKTLGEAVAEREAIVGLLGPRTRLVLDLNDDRFSERDFTDFYRSLAPRADGWIASTEQLAKRVRSVLKVDATVVPDCFEGLPAEPRAPPGALTRRLRQTLDRLIPVAQPPAELSVLWFGHPSNLPGLVGALDELRRAADVVPVELLCITKIDDQIVALAAKINQTHAPRLRARFIEWTAESMRAGLAACDLVVIPADLARPGALAKSANRLLEALIAGRFAICSPVPAYLEFQEYAWIGERLDQGIRWAIENPARVARRVREGQRYVLEHYSAPSIAARWLAALERVSQRARRMPEFPAAAGELRLNIGCGDKILAGYVNVDTVAGRAGARPDVICDIRDLHPFADASAQEVLSVHVVEHFPAWEIEQVIREWIRVLRPGGRLVVECPNVVYACEQIAQQPAEASKAWGESSHLMWVLYGDPRWRDPLMAHWWGYTSESLCELLRRAGLVDVRQEPAQFKRREPRDMRVVGIKPGALETAARAPVSVKRPATTAAAAVAGSIGEQYLKWYHQTDVWKRVSYRGIRTLKNVMDMWNYQEIFSAHRIEWVLETGTRHGGSALYFADLLENSAAPGQVISVDVDSGSLEIGPHPRIRLIGGSSTSPEVVDQVIALLPAQRGPLFVILDSDHRRDHVLRELELYVPLMREDDYLVVEDTCVNGHPVREEHGPGPWEAVAEFLHRHPGLLRWDREREEKFGATFAPRGYFVRL